MYLVSIAKILARGIKRNPIPKVLEKTRGRPCQSVELRTDATNKGNTIASMEDTRMLSLRKPTYMKCSSALCGLPFGKFGFIFLNGDHVLGDEPVFFGNEGQVVLGYVLRHERLKDYPAKLPAGGNRAIHEHIGKVITGIEIIHLGGLYEAVHQRTGLGPILAAMGDPVLRPKFHDLHEAFAP
ncbi:MAG: hypothetical protein JJE17_00360 [Peptostreptococcaceae bacterium]|nr:hypothetical protein [Peptostreptococcaceae bacterium]